MTIKFRRTHPDAQIPRYATAGAACFDFHAVERVEIPPTFAVTIRTGLAPEIPPGKVMKIYSRSGHGFKSGIRLSNCVGVIDSDYRGEIMVRLHNDGDHTFIVEVGDRIAQGGIEDAPQVEIIEAFEMSATDRGAGGFGSTGA
jgi:dUTP pyrophosphatase